MTDDGILHAYADASMRDGIIGLEYVIVRHGRDSRDRFVEASHCFLSRDEQPYEYMIKQAEYRACISAVRAATAYCDDAVFVHNDNKQVVQAIQNREPIHDEGYFQHAFYSFAERFDAWVCSWTPRENNLAHTEAARGRELHENLRSEGVEV